MACNVSNADTLGGNQFNALQVAAGIKDTGSTRATGRHGANNLWQKWPKLKTAGITSRAPYNIGTPKTPNTLAGSTLHTKGLDLGPHGHGIGVVPAAIGGAHNARTLKSQISAQRTASGGFELLPAPNLKICWKCATTWLIVGAVVLVLAVFSGK